MSRSRAEVCTLVAIAPLCCAALAQAAPGMTLDEALREAGAANARLPPAEVAVEISRATVREAHGNLWPAISLGGDIRYEHPSGSEQVLEAFVRGPLYDGGRLRAQVRQAEANTTGAVARYRQTDADLELDVRKAFAQELEADAELDIRQAAGARLAQYVELIRLRQAGGQGLEGDLLTAQAELATERAAQHDAMLAAAHARYQLNDLLGRDPTAPLTLVPLPEPSVPATNPRGEPWMDSHDVHAADADIRAADAAIGVAKAEHRPSLSFELAGGYLGVPPAATPGESLSSRALRGFGFSAMITYSWTLLDLGGAYAARVEQARLAGLQAQDQRTVVARAARLSYDSGRLDVDELAAELTLRESATAAARDAYLATETIYRGGAGTSLAVIDANRTWIDAALAEASARLRYEVAAAQLRRWSGAP